MFFFFYILASPFFDYIFLIIIAHNVCFNYPRRATQYSTSKNGARLQIIKIKNKKYILNWQRQLSKMDKGFNGGCLHYKRWHQQCLSLHFPPVVTIISLHELEVLFWDWHCKGIKRLRQLPACANNAPFFEQRYKSLTMRKHQFTWFSSQLLIFALGFSGVGLFNWRTATK